MTDERIVVVGAGYAGLATATRAGRHREVTLIAPEERFLHRVRQHETAAGRPEHRPALADLVRGSRVTRVPAEVTAIDLAARTLHTDTAGPVPYDVLVYALGSRTAFHGVPGAAEHSYPAERAAALHRRLAASLGPASLAVVGGGATGIEMAAELAEAHPEHRVRLLAADRVGGWLSARGQRHVRRALHRLGVTIDDGRTVTAVTPGGLETDRGPVPADAVVWAASMEPHPLAAEAGLDVTAGGQVVVDDHLRSVSHPEVYAVGDAAAVTLPGRGALRMGCATALPMGTYLGRVLGGRAPRPFAFSYAAQCLSLGRRDGLLQLVRADDSMRPLVLTGTPGRLVKAAIVRAVTPRS
ncbi:FAD-dependent oxidoreductase [Streptomyces sp. NPDC049906]|uniref:NAD(P)/FAD-dependent oxidoreductase n=1 Tax=Streptomyces sp. NPDC049906 TaxID=3155656 RepID=UPI003420298B